MFHPESVFLPTVRKKLLSARFKEVSALHASQLRAAIRKKLLHIKQVFSKNENIRSIFIIMWNNVYTE